MKKVLIDTNIILDLLDERMPFFENAWKLFSLAETRELVLGISSLSLANTNYYLIKKMPSSLAKTTIRRFKLLVNVLPLNDRIIDLALNDEKIIDFEDGLQYYSAIEFGYEIIITRNQKDFKNSNIPVMSPFEFLTSLK